ncbi:glycosyltransferase [Candidatus Bathyarchaeota archaeon]|nr:glycosyltransferase [Candidatus Bathyarchaeota archaeon]
MTNKVFVVLPCYNEEMSLSLLAERIDEACAKMDYSVIAVDDGSKDQTYATLLKLQKHFPIIIKRHTRNMGLQAALRTGLTKAASTAKDNGDGIVVMDADLTHDPKYIPHMIAALAKGYDVAIGSRYVKGGVQLGVPVHRQVLSIGMRFVSMCLFRLPVRDVTSGYRAYRAELLKRLLATYGDSFIESKGFEVAFELLIKTCKLGARFAEIPLRLDYSKKKSRSKLAVQKTIFNYFKLILRNLKISFS